MTNTKKHVEKQRAEQAPSLFRIFMQERSEHILEYKHEPAKTYISTLSAISTDDVKNVLWNIFAKVKAPRTLEALYTIRDSNPRHPD